MAATVLTGTVLAPAARAVSATFQVTNESGVQQFSGYFEGGAFMGSTDGFGQVTIDRPAGSTITFSRSQVNSTEPACNAPEGAGVGYTFPAEAPGTPVAITLPSAQQGNPYSPSPSNDERWIIGKVNVERAKLGRGPLEISATLTEAADRYASLLNATNQLSHCASSSPVVRAIDAGWINRTVAENAGVHPDMASQFTGWMTSPAHHDNMLNASYASAGIARVGSYSVLMLAPSCAGNAAAGRCRMTGDLGDPNLPISDPQNNPANPTSPTTPSLKRSGLKVLSVARKGRRLRIQVAIKATAKGSVSLVAKRGSKRARVTMRAGRRGRFTYYVAVTKRGRYRIGLRFRGRSGWRNTAACRSVTVQSASRRVNPKHYTRVKARRC